MDEDFDLNDLNDLSPEQLEQLQHNLPPEMLQQLEAQFAQEMQEEMDEAPVCSQSPLWCAATPPAWAPGRVSSARIGFCWGVSVMGG